MTKLAGQHILIAEDEAMIALFLNMAVEDEGASTVETSVANLRMPLDLKKLDAALLDVNLADGPVFPLADLLVSAGVPIVFHTGRGDIKSIQSRYPNAIALTKPAPENRIIEALAHRPALVA